jgi:hypothetical protein
MSASKRPSEKRLSLTNLLYLSYPRNRWLGALREEILNSDIKTWDFRIAIFTFALLIYSPLISVLINWLPSSITENFFFFLFELILIFIIGIKTFGILKRWAEIDKEREREILAERIQQDQHSRISEQTTTNSLFFDKKHSRKTYPGWIRKLYSYFFSSEEKTGHYVFFITIMFIIFLAVAKVDDLINNLNRFIFYLIKVDIIYYILYSYLL